MIHNSTFSLVILGCVLAVACPAQAVELSEVSVELKVWAALEGYDANADSPFAPAAKLAGFGQELGRGEALVRLRYHGLTAEVSSRSTARSGDTLYMDGVVNELFYEAEALGQHLTVGKKVMSWDVGFGFRPLDVVQQEARRALCPFALEGVPLVAWEWFGEDSALTLAFANPVQLRVSLPRDDESIAARYYHKLGPVDLHVVSRYSERTELQSGVAMAAVLGDYIEVHGSFRYQRRDERLVNSLTTSAGQSLATTDPNTLAVAHDTIAALVGFTVTPGSDLSIIGEAWLDPSAATRQEWRSLATLVERQSVLLDDPSVPRVAVLGNLAWGLRAFDRPNLLRENLMLHVSWKWERFEPSANFLFTPEDNGWAATAIAAYQGESTRLDAGIRYVGGPSRSAYRLLPESAMVYAGMQVFF